MIPVIADLLEFIYGQRYTLCYLLIACLCVYLGRVSPTLLEWCRHVVRSVELLCGNGLNCMRDRPKGRPRASRRRPGKGYRRLHPKLCSCGWITGKGLWVKCEKKFCPAFGGSTPFGSPPELKEKSPKLHAGAANVPRSPVTRDPLAGCFRKAYERARKLSMNAWPETLQCRLYPKGGVVAQLMVSFTWKHVRRAYGSSPATQALSLGVVINRPQVERFHYDGAIRSYESWNTDGRTRKRLSRRDVRTAYYTSSTIYCLKELRPGSQAVYERWWIGKPPASSWVKW